MGLKRLLNAPILLPKETQIPVLLEQLYLLFRNYKTRISGPVPPVHIFTFAPRMAQRLLPLEGGKQEMRFITMI